MQDTSQTYAKCAEIKKQKFVNECDDETIKSLATDFDIPPLFESRMFEKAFMRHYSMVNNEHLRCRWREYVAGIESRQFTPFALPDISELHFYNCAIRFLPGESIRYHDHKLKLKPGPGVDNVGQMPIPQEALMKRGTAVTVKSDKVKRAGKREIQKGGKKYLEKRFY